MTIGLKQLYINDIIWHCISIFYAKTSFAGLLNAIDNFYKTHKNRIKHFSFYFSNVQGEHINLVFIPENVETECSTSALCDDIEQYFGQFLKENPSENPYPLPYGSVLWLPYSNNLLVWNVFPVQNFLFENQEMRDFAQVTSLLIINLYDAVSSYEENVLSIAMLLFVKIWKKHNIALPAIIDPESEKILQSYWEYDEDELLTKWLQNANITTSAFVFCSQLNLPEDIYNFILEPDKKL